MRRLVCTLLMVLLSILPLSAQETGRNTPSTMLVLDASGSMWGQIDGVNKIVIAREVISGLLTQIPDNMALGLTMYGHRRRGDCSDIEVMVQPATGADNRAQIERLVNTVNPRGRTPLSDAVVQAAEALRYTENAATVILVSDGRETCDVDPCAVGTALEEAGIDFTAHVIGFDVAAPEDIAQLQCLAENTGGQYLSADNAEELAQALEQVAVAPPPPPMTHVTLRGVVGPDHAAPTSPLIWEVTDATGQVVYEATEAPSISTDLLPGDYLVHLTRVVTETQHGGTVSVTLPGPQEFLFVMPPLIPDASLTAPDEAYVDSAVPVQWTGPGADNDYILLATADRSASFQQVFPRDGNPLQVTLPSEAGDYLLQYVDGAGNRVLAERAIRALPAPATLQAPETAVAGATIQVAWDGPDARNDMITVASSDMPGSRNINDSYTRQGTPLDLQMPAFPGSYVIRYVLNEGSRVLASRAITVTEVTATLDAPDTAVAGDTIAVEWTGPDYRNDTITVAAADQPGNRSINDTYTRQGTPLQLQMPSQPGTYEIRYVMNQDHRVIARRTITVTEVSATLDAPDLAEAGATLPVTWTGPDYRNDAITVARVDAGGNSYENYSYTRGGSPARVLMPTEPGEYELRYLMNQDNRVLARRIVTVTDVVATLETQATAVAGATVRVHWTGPDYQNDYISVSRLDDPDGYENYTYTRTGTPVSLVMPTDPGDYEVRYVVNQDRTILARHPITVTEVGATLDAPETATAGASIPVAWTGPDYDNDYVAISRPDDPSGYENYTYTRTGTPLTLDMPTQPGEYELRYVINQDRTIIARRSITVTEVGATLDAADTANAGDTVTVAWTGPDYDNDYVAVSRLDDDSGYENYTYTRDGSPLMLTMPVTPGQYELRYVVNQDRTIIARRPITVTEVDANLEAPETAIAGATITISWTGPDYRNDYIGISRLDDDSGYENYTYTRDGSPLRLQMPATPGSYELRYFVNQDRTILARRTIEVTALSATVSGPQTARVGQPIVVEWTGPDYRNDFIAVSRQDDPDGYENYTYTRDGTPLRVTAPTEPGAYELRYVVSQDRSVHARSPITIEDITVTLQAPATATAGGRIAVEHDGPDYRNDYIGISRLDDPEGYETYTYTRDGDPVLVDLPDSPGDYEIRYFMNQDRRIIGRAPLTVTAP
ncbi:VWA domain-containing protein [Nioella nitratireducens]|uniref:VWA domain-containing protein n=1 Tax=Nioella nitratireducens TaxID=1287720 RepID=UPI0008FD72E6|nr:VWA domain-containing protein [Nioella nitratireducens]